MPAPAKRDCQCSEDDAHGEGHKIDYSRILRRSPGAEGEPIGGHDDNYSTVAMMY